MSWNRFVNHLFWHYKQPCIPVPERLPHSQPFDVAVVKTLFWLFSEPACSKRGLQTVDRFLLIKTPTPCWASSHLHQSSEEKSVKSDSTDSKKKHNSGCRIKTTAPAVRDQNPPETEVRPEGHSSEPRGDLHRRCPLTHCLQNFPLLYP